jgi:hypothetical protein
MYRVYSEIKNEFQFSERKTQEYKEAWALLLRKVGRKNAEKYKLTIKKEEVHKYFFSHILIYYLFNYIRSRLNDN